MDNGRFSNITDEIFWDSKYSLNQPYYSLTDPYYGKNGLLAKTLGPYLSDLKNVLELGCASSRYMMFFKVIADLNTYGLDFSKQGLFALEKMATHFGVNHHLQFGDMFQHEMNQQKFDLVFHSGLVEHFENTDSFFRRCRFFCKTGGRMIFLMPNMGNYAWKWHKHLCPTNYSFHIRYKPEDLIDKMSPYFQLNTLKSWGYPQIYAGGPPESTVATLLKWLNMGLMLSVSYLPGYRGSVGRKLSSTWLFACTAL